MLVLERKVQESIQIGDDITVKVLLIDERSVKLGIAAPTNIHILRDDCVNREKKENSHEDN